MGLMLGLGVGIPAAILVVCGIAFGVLFDRRKAAAKETAESAENDKTAEINGNAVPTEDACTINQDNISD